jgi:lipopolysaccharide export system permease protein
MTLLTRYILNELLKVFLLTLTGLTVLIVVTLVANEAMKRGLGIGPILRLIPYALPQSLIYSVPGTVLFAACSVYGRMSAANEVIVLKSIGLSPWVAVMPGLLLALLISFVGVFLNDYGYSWGFQGLQRVVIQSAEEIAYGVLRTQRTYSTERFAISVKEVEGKTLVRPTITFRGEGKSPPVTISAETAHLSSNLERNTLSIFLTDGIVEVGDRVTGVFPNTFERVIPLAEASQKGISSSPSHMPLSRVPEAKRAAKVKIREVEEANAAEAAFALVTGDYAGVGEQTWQHRRANAENAHGHLNRLNMEAWRRAASGFSCLCFMFVGAPLALWLRHADFMTNFFYCFFPILLFYYPLFLTSLDMAKEGSLPGCCVWLGNLACVAVGLWLMNKVLKH